MATNPYLRNPLIAGLGALSGGIALGEQQQRQRAAQKATAERQAMLDAAKAQMDSAQARNYDASAGESIARGKSYGVTAENTRRQDLMSEIDKVNQNIPKYYEIAGGRGDRSQLDAAIAYRQYLMSQLGGDAGNLVAPPAPAGVGVLGMPAQTAGMGDGNLGTPQPTLPPFAQGLQQANTPPKFDVEDYLGVPKPPTNPIAGLPASAPQAPQGIPQRPQAADPYDMGAGVRMNPQERETTARVSLVDAQTKKANAEALNETLKTGDPMTIIPAIGMRPQREQRLFAEEVNARLAQAGSDVHIPVPGVDFNGYYGPDIKTAADVKDLIARTHKTNVDAMLAPWELREKREHNQRADAIAQQNANQTGAHYGAQDTIAGDKFAYQQEQGAKNDPATQRLVTSWTSQVKDLQGAIDSANKAQAAAVASTDLTPAARKTILETQDAIKRDALVKQQELKNKIDSAGQQQGASNLGDAAAPDFNPIKFLGASVNKDNAPGCADGVCKIAKAAGLPVPQTRSAGEFERQLPSKGWVQIPVDQASKNDIITTKGSGPSGRHVQWSLGGGKVLEADSRASGYSNKLAMGTVGSGSKAWRYAGGGQKRTANTSGAPSGIPAKIGRFTVSAP